MVAIAARHLLLSVVIRSLGPAVMASRWWQSQVCRNWESRYEIPQKSLSHHLSQRGGKPKVRLSRFLGVSRTEVRELPKKLWSVAHVISATRQSITWSLIQLNNFAPHFFVPLNLVPHFWTSTESWFRAQNSITRILEVLGVFCGCCHWIEQME